MRTLPLVAVLVALLVPAVAAAESTTVPTAEPTTTVQAKPSRGSIELTVTGYNLDGFMVPIPAMSLGFRLSDNVGFAASVASLGIVSRVGADLRVYSGTSGMTGYLYGGGAVWMAAWQDEEAYSPMALAAGLGLEVNNGSMTFRVQGGREWMGDEGVFALQAGVGATF